MCALSAIATKASGNASNGTQHRRNATQHRRNPTQHNILFGRNIAIIKRSITQLRGAALRSTAIKIHDAALRSTRCCVDAALRSIAKTALVVMLLGANAGNW